MADITWDLSSRDAIRRRVTEVLVADSRVDRVELVGSLADGASDIYSDIDLRVQLKPGVIDREFFFDVSALMDEVGPRVTEGWSFSALPRFYVWVCYFEDLPLFWHVDIDCRPASGEWHIDSSDLSSVPRWEQRYKVWVESMLRLTRQEAGVKQPIRKDFQTHFQDMKMRMSRRLDLSSLVGSYSEQMLQLLKLENTFHAAQGISVGELGVACEELWQDVFGELATAAEA